MSISSPLTLTTLIVNTTYKDVELGNLEIHTDLCCTAVGLGGKKRKSLFWNFNIQEKKHCVWWMILAYRMWETQKRKIKPLQIGCLVWHLQKGNSKLKQDLSQGRLFSSCMMHIQKGIFTSVKASAITQSAFSQPEWTVEIWPSNTDLLLKVAKCNDSTCNVSGESDKYSKVKF